MCLYICIYVCSFIYAYVYICIYVYTYIKYACKSMLQQAEILSAVKWWLQLY